jgi:hypothetical protein
MTGFQPETDLQSVDAAERQQSTDNASLFAVHEA